MPSFKDSDGDGYSDFKGMTGKLDYIQSLGIRGIWLTPFLQSPKVDNGYDISDYYQIDEWDASGNSYVWVRINHTSSTEDTHVVMFYGNATAVGQNSTEVWDSDYIMVQHLNETSGNHIDSTSEDNYLFPRNN